MRIRMSPHSPIARSQQYSKFWTVKTRDPQQFSFSRESFTLRFIKIGPQRRSHFLSSDIARHFSCSLIINLHVILEINPNFNIYRFTINLISRLSSFHSKIIINKTMLHSRINYIRRISHLVTISIGSYYQLHNVKLKFFQTFFHS